MPIGLFNVHGKDTESEHVIAIKQCKWKFSTCVLLLQPRISVPGSTKSMQAGNSKDRLQQEISQIKNKAKLYKLLAIHGYK